MPRRSVCAAALAALAVAGCGGSQHATSTSATTTTVASSTSPGTTTATSTTRSVSAGPTTTAATTSAPEVPKNRTPKHSKPTKPDTNVRIPAAFVIGTGGTVTPPLISLPPNVRIELQLANHDSKPHSITLSVRHFRAVSVAAGAARTTEITGVAKGTYTLSVDGAGKAKIVVGVVPGP